MKRFLTFLSEPEGKISFARLTGFLLVLFYVVAGVYVVIKEHKIPELPLNLMLLISLLYGLNKVEKIFKVEKKGE